MLHPALARALAVAHSEDLQRAAARRQTVRLARRVKHELRLGPNPFAVQLSASESAASTSCVQADGMTPTETAQAAPWPCESVVRVRSGARAAIDRASSDGRPASSLTRTSHRSE
jgi:hypothetical protein